jgi:trehalose-phosphatase
VEEKHVISVWEAVDAVASRHAELRVMAGKKVVELLPRMDWDKGKALKWLLDALHLEEPNVVPLYLGDDRTDEDAFSALQHVGLGIVVGHGLRPTIAHYRLESPNEVAEFLRSLIAMMEASA